MKKQKEIYSSSIGDDLDGLSIEAACLKLQEMAAEVKRAHPSVDVIKLDYDHAEWDEGNALYLKGSRPETDSEERARESRDKLNNKQREDYEKRQYEALKKKFG